MIKLEGFEKPFPVVGIDASAGGLEAVSELLAELPAVTGMAYLLVQHLDPLHQSFLTEILAKKSIIKVETAVDGTTIEQDHLYVIPPNKTLTVVDRRLRLTARESQERPHKPVNLLFRSLAEQYKHLAVAVVLSGTDSDGAQGLQEVKVAGGITMAQEPASAKFDGMPKSAIATGCVDLVLTPAELGREMLRIARHPYLSTNAPSEELKQEEDRLKDIFRLLQSRSGTDFSRYKRSTVQRRLARRMALRQVDGLAEYRELLKREPEEIQALAQDFLIRVTGFFRDPQTFVGLRESVLPALFENSPPDGPLRIWVPGCASGEEVYSIAIVILEYLGARAPSVRIQIFGTDLSETAIEKARIGFYTDSIADEVSPERLQRFFVKLDDHYQISKAIRDLCVFARHDLTRDPPFSRLNLVSCRNLLIYLDQTLQRQIIPLFHYALNPGGFLSLGAAETIGQSSGLFRLVEGHRQIYQRQPVPTRAMSEFPVVEASARPRVSETLADTVAAPLDSERAQREAERLLLTRYAPASVLIDDSLNVLYFNGETSRYLEHVRGAASLNLQKICRPGLLVEISPAIQEAQASQRSVVREGVRIELPDENRTISFEITPVNLSGLDSSYFLILFDQVPVNRSVVPPAGLLVRLWGSLFRASPAGESENDAEIARLRRELDATRGFLQTALEEHETAKEEMKSAHEEALSANEEFLSTNEELETAKEELQSTNEELGVTNQELRDRNRELSNLNDELQKSRSYLNAIVETLREPLLVLDGDLRVQSANREFYETFNVRQEDTIKRHIYDLAEGQWDIPELRRLLEKVLPENSSFRDFEVKHDFPGLGEKTLLLNARRLPSTDRRDEMLLLAIEDVTARQLSQTKLIQSDQRKNKFLATLAHELRNPLAPIRLGISLLRRDAKVKDVKQLDMMDRQIERLVRLVDGLLDIARIERDHIELEKNPIDLVAIVHQSIESSRLLIEGDHHKLSLSLPSQPIRVMADSIRLEQIVSNLLNNAAKYTAVGGEIAVSVEPHGEEAWITIRDNGIGIAPELLPQLFEMFFQIDTSLDRAGGGLGIGLAIAKRLVELHGGSIEGRSEGLGKGSEFTIRLPLLRDADSQDNVRLISESALATKSPTILKVLIVDDIDDTAEASAEFVRSLGHEVAVASNGTTALELFQKFQPDLALIDIGLPGMSGYELARRLRELPGTEKVSLVAITGYAREEDRKASAEAGFDLHLVKPVDTIRLKRLLDTLE